MYYVQERNVILPSKVGVRRWASRRQTARQACGKWWSTKQKRFIDKKISMVMMINSGPDICLSGRIAEFGPPDHALH